MPNSETGNLMTVEEFREYVEDGFLVDYDGHGRLVRNGEVERKGYILPSEVNEIPQDVTHIRWYNR